MKRNLMLSPAQGLLWMFSIEHNLFGEARRALGAVPDSFAEARSQWRILLGMSTR